MIPQQNKSKILLIIIGILLVANIALVSFFLLKKDGGKHEKRMDRQTMIAGFLKKEIGFNAEQLKQYERLSSTHQADNKKMFETSHGMRDKQFKELTAADFNDSVMNSNADRSASFQKTMELKMFNHLRNIRMLCTTEQQPKFDSLFGKMLNKRGLERKRIKIEKK